MSKRTNDLYSNIEFIPDEPDNNSSTVSDNESHKHSSHSTEHSGSSTHHDSHHNSADVIIDNADGNGFDVDWDTIEKNYRHRHHHSSSGHHHSSRPNSHSSHHSSRQMNDSSDEHNKAKSDKKKKKWSKKKKVIIGILLFLFCVIIGITITFFIMRYMGREAILDYTNMHMTLPDDIDYEDNGKTVYYNGHTYQFNDNIASVLFMGVDNRELVENAVAATAGQADALYLFTYDTSTGKIKVLALNRDTMADISRYDAAGQYYDTETTQLCLAYAFGDGKKLSAENQVTAVERLIYNIPINAYYAIDLSAIKILNDDIGGVTLTPEYTFKSFTKGQPITIKGDLAEEFVRHRDTSLVDDNLRRMSCQRLYINSFVNQIIPAIKNDFRLPLKLYQDSSKYTVTNLNANIMTYLASTLALNYSGLNMVTTEGKYKMVKDDVSAQFKLDKKDFFEKILDIYYIQVK